MLRVVSPAEAEADLSRLQPRLSSATAQVSLAHTRSRLPPSMAKFWRAVFWYSAISLTADIHEHGVCHAVMLAVMTWRQDMHGLHDIFARLEACQMNPVLL